MGSDWASSVTRWVWGSVNLISSDCSMRLSSTASVSDVITAGIRSSVAKASWIFSATASVSIVSRILSFFTAAPSKSPKLSCETSVKLLEKPEVPKLMISVSSVAIESKRLESVSAELMASSKELKAAFSSTVTKFWKSKSKVGFSSEASGSKLTRSTSFSISEILRSDWLLSSMSKSSEDFSSLSSEEVKMSSGFSSKIGLSFLLAAPGITSKTGSWGVGKLSNELWNSEVLRIKEAESGVGASWLSIITDAGPDWDSRLDGAESSAEWPKLDSSSG